jgi:hypothetical protein
MRPRIESGTKRYGVEPSVVPSKPFGATPTIVIGCPLTIIDLFTTFGSAPRRVSQNR